MIFDHRSLYEISNDEIINLVYEHAPEDNHLEYKLTINYQEHKDRFELLCDIASLANAGGGYMIVGIRDNGKGNAQIFESVVNAEKIVQSIYTLTIDNISERVEGLQSEIRTIEGKDIIIIRVPNSSRRPHMVTYNNNTHFTTRYQHGKREMSIDEIRSAFTENTFGKRLSSLESGISELLSHRKKSDKKSLIDEVSQDLSRLYYINDGEVVAESLRKIFESRIGDTPYFRICITPEYTSSNLVDFDSKQIENLLKNPPNQRPNGWNMENPYTELRRHGMGITRRSEQDNLVLMSNGFFDFSIKISESNFLWNQSVEEAKTSPRLYPYPLIEYPLSFLQLYKEIISRVDYSGDFLFYVYFYNIKGFTLRPYSPNQTGFMTRSPGRYSGEALFIHKRKVENSFVPDHVTFDLLKYLYNSFNYSKEQIPYFDSEKGTFTLD